MDFEQKLEAELVAAFKPFGDAELTRILVSEYLPKLASGADLYLYFTPDGRHVAYDAAEIRAEARASNPPGPDTPSCYFAGAFAFDRARDALGVSGTGAGIVVMDLGHVRRHVEGSFAIAGVPII